MATRSIADQTALVRQARAALNEARRQRERVATFVAARHLREGGSRSRRRRARDRRRPPPGRARGSAQPPGGARAAALRAGARAPAARRHDAALADRRRRPRTARVRRRVSRRRHADRHRRPPASAAAAARGARARRDDAARRPAGARHASKAIRRCTKAASSRVSPSIAEGTRTLPIEAEIPNVDGKLAPGHVCEGRHRHRRRAGARRSAVARWSCSPASRRSWSSRTARPTNSACAPACASATASRCSRASSAGDVVIVAPGGLADGSPVTIARVSRAHPRRHLHPAPGLRDDAHHGAGRRRRARRSCGSASIASRPSTCRT